MHRELVLLGLMDLRVSLDEMILKTGLQFSQPTGEICKQFRTKLPQRALDELFKVDVCAWGSFKIFEMISV